MELLRTVEEVRRWRAEVRSAGRRLGFVPTMGALHAGHRSLIDTARAANEAVAVSIFVNPTQFGPQEDFAHYPRPLEADLALCREAGVDAVFHPEPETMYPLGFCTWVEVRGPLAESFEGAVRPGHFRGVATVVLKLFEIVQPDRAYFGQKDAQQACLVRRMIADLNLPVELHVCPTVREADGLALSSRNVYLTPEQRRMAPILFQALQRAEAAILQGERRAQTVIQIMEETMATVPEARLDYAAVVDPNSFLPVKTISDDVLLLLAARFGNTRLIDNLPISFPRNA
ncbi:MAG: pantoate--beta-alanine ligase [Gemmatales bacterium]|nr:pantoate--beta-alanine ligase [Gemmatales bacterium]MDW8385540.1 pantoate--beta-alanine ligase [Gemmatales bacterium]